MALDINTIKQASPKANQVATEQYVDTSIAAIDVTQDISANNDIFAQKLGYLNYASMVAAASTGQTIINGGYVNTSLLQANSINAGMINTVGLIAENISANEIIGKTISGSTLNGAVINGAVIKASYLDLDGELEVLTNYHITPAMYAANPSLYTDAVYIEATNEYRIPSLSSISEPTVISTGLSARTLNGTIRSYNCGNAVHNLKSVKLRPFVVIYSQIDIFIGSMTQTTGKEFNGTNYPLSGNNVYASYGSGMCSELWLGNTLLLRFASYCPYGNAHRGYIYDAIANTYLDTGLRHAYASLGLYSRTLTLNSAYFKVTGVFSTIYDKQDYGESTVSSSTQILMDIKLEATSFTLPFDFSDTNARFRIVNVLALPNGSSTIKLSNSLSINNMI